MKRRYSSFLFVSLPFLSAMSAGSASAEVRLSAIFGDHMVLQQNQRDRIWGWADPAEDVTVAIAQQTRSTRADSEGKWSVELEPMPAGGPHTMTVKGKNEIRLEDILVGEVWVCSGQSNMEWPVRSANDGDLETRTAKYPNIRLITVPKIGTQEPQSDFRSEWRVCSPETVPNFSAVGYFFGRLLHRTLDVPVGLINNSWGGSACEAWVRRDLLASDERYAALLERWAQIEKNYDAEKVKADYQQRVAEWQEAAQKAQSEGRPAPPRPQAPGNQLAGNARPGNIYNGMVKPIIGYGIRGMIWYQGETNAPRAYQYRHLFPLMIKSWRDEWSQGDFPFYWVQLADYRDEKAEPTDSDWAELREAQTMTLSALPNTGEAVIIDLGESQDIHPRNKQDVAKRLARWALARDYGIPVAYGSPIYKSMEKKENKIVLTFDRVGAGLKTFDVREVRGFAIAGNDHKFVWAKAGITGIDSVEVWSDQVPDPVAVRYAWADNPVCNLQSREGLPVTPFRTDDWPGVTVNNQK
ncbi:MAG TPA: sialate O-acetylesterase [Acidobacteriota bacterium]|nr:sialate O-acetylesterase [Acidobacteriota bacterium]